MGEYFELFKTKAEAVNAEVYRVANGEEAMTKALQIISEYNVKSVSGTELKLMDGHKLAHKLKELGVRVELGKPSRQFIEEATVGISEFVLASAETGSLVQDATDVYARLVSSLSTYHLAILDTKGIKANFAEALQAVFTGNGNKMPGYVSYISGPSRTADIERVLAIGVHGPEKLFVICVG